MHPSLRSRLRTGFLPTATGLLFLVVLPTASAQTPTATSSSSAATESTPPPQQRTVITNDNIKFPLVPHPPHSAAAPTPQPAPLVQKSSHTQTEDVAKNSGQIAELQKQIRDKRKRIELLMRLFVTDERQFVQFPTDAQADPRMEARIRSEQEELRAETAACARLQTRLDALTAADASSH